VPAWLPSSLALGALLFALVAAPGDSGDMPLLQVVAEAQVSDLGGDAAALGETVAAEPAPAAEADEPSEPDAARGPNPLTTPIDAWPIAVPRGRIDAVSARGDTLYLAVEEPPDRPLIDPALVRVHAIGRDGTQADRPWQAAILGASPLALASSGSRTLAAWTHRAHPGRDLAVARLDGEGEARFEVIPPIRDGAPAPVGRPLLAPAANGGFLACVNTASGAPRCAALDGEGVHRWSELRGLRHYALWQLLPGGDGFFLFATDCKRDRWSAEDASALSCRTPRIVLQALDGDGDPRGKLRWIARFQGNRELGVVPLGDDVVLFGRRSTARDSTALIVRRRVVEELEGRWNRTAAGLASAEGALFLEVAKLHMEDGVPVAGFRPRRWDAREGRSDPESWPESVAAHAPTSLEQRLVAGPDVIALVSPPEGELVRGVALRVGRDRGGLAQAPAAGAPAP